MISERMEVTPIISIEPRGVYHFGYPLFLALLTTKFSSFDDFNKNRIFLIKLTAGVK